MWYVYVLRSLKNKRFYTGLTSDLRRRVGQHNSSTNTTSYTRRTGPYELIFYEAFLDKKDAERAERFFKSGYGREVLRNKLKHYLNK